MGRPPTHRAFHSDHPDSLPGAAPECNGLIRSLYSRIQDKWRPVVKWCDGCDMVWPYDPDKGVQEPKVQEREPDPPVVEIDEVVTRYLVKVTDAKQGTLSVAICTRCGWRSEPLSDTEPAESDHWETGHPEIDPDSDVLDFDYESTDEEIERRWRATSEPPDFYADPEDAGRYAFSHAHWEGVTVRAVPIIERDLDRDELAAARRGWEQAKGMVIQRQARTSDSARTGG